MSTPGSVRSGEESQYTAPETAREAGSGKREAKPRRTRIFRWQGIIPLVLGFALLFVGWTLFGERTIRDTISEAGTKALGTQLDIGELKIRTFASTVELRGIALADPFDRTRNLFEVARVQLELEPRPLLEKKLVVKRLSIADVRTGTRRATPASAVTGPGFAPRALAEVKRFAQQFNVPLLSLTPFDTLKALALDPTKLKAVQAALSLASSADSLQRSIDNAYAALRLQETVDSSAALAARLQNTNVRTLGLDGARRAVADLRRAGSRVDSAKARVEGLMTLARRGVDSLQTGLRGIDDARRADYAFARGLLQLPSFDAPDIGSALFGKVTIDKFQQAVYWTELARQYAPPGLLPKESPGPKRMRRAGSTVHFAKPQSTPRFLLRRADVNVTVGGSLSNGAYAFAASDVTTDPAIVGRPTLFAIRRAAKGSDLDSLRVVGSLDHTGARPREIVNAQAAGVKLPTVSLPALPYSMDPGRGTSEMRFVFDGDQLSGKWVVRSANVTWKQDSSRVRKLNALESLVARVLTGVNQLDMTADISGTLKAPRLAVKSNLDRQIADRLKAVAGEQIAAAQAKVRAQVDKLVDEKSAPVKARIGELRADSERRVADARTKLEAEKRKLDERIKALSGGLVGLPRLPGD
ncbi:MAG TPA: TIGR03545 family protein [Gemmatimonadaceae bacterium]